MIYLGIDIGGTRLKAGVVDENGRLVRQVTGPSPATRPEMEATLHDLAWEVLSGESPDAVGFGCKGIVDAAAATVITMPGMWSFLEGIPLRQLVAPSIAPGTPVTADNDAKAALAGEMLWGAARGRRNALLLTLGTGVGGGILAEGKILRGAGNVAGHLGHITADPNGPPCICGNRGCLEAVFSARAIEAQVWAAVHQGVASPMLNGLRAEPELLSCEYVYQQAAAGDPIARHILDRATIVLAGAMAGLIHAFDPEVFILTGSIAAAGDALFEPLRREVAWRTSGLIKREIPIVPCGVEDHSGTIGAAALAAQCLAALS